MSNLENKKDLWEVVDINEQQIINEICLELEIDTIYCQPTPKSSPMLTQVATPTVSTTPFATPIDTPAVTPVVTSKIDPVTNISVIPISNKLMLPIMLKTIEEDEYSKYSKGNEYNVVVALIGEWLKWKKQIASKKLIFPCRCKHHFIHSTQYLHFNCVSLGSINKKLPSYVVSIIDEIRKKQYPPKPTGCDTCKTYLCSICSYSNFGLLKEGQINCTHPYHL
jgi:hypothetical protein